MKHYFASIGFGLLLTTWSGFSAPVPADTNFFPIMAWNGAPKDPAVLQKMRECGLTIAGFAAPDALAACRAAGLKAIVSDARTSGYDWANVDEAKARKNVASLVAKVGRNPAVFGYYLRDEPGHRHVPGFGKGGGTPPRAFARQVALHQPLPRLRHSRPTRHGQLPGLPGAVHLKIDYATCPAAILQLYMVCPQM